MLLDASFILQKHAVYFHLHRALLITFHLGLLGQNVLGQLSEPRYNLVFSWLLGLQGTGGLLHVLYLLEGVSFPHVAVCLESAVGASGFGFSPSYRFVSHLF